MYANDQRLGRRVKLSYDQGRGLPWTGYGPFFTKWKEGLFAGQGDYGICVQFDDGTSDWFEEDRVHFIKE